MKSVPTIVAVVLGVFALADSSLAQQRGDNGCGVCPAVPVCPGRAMAAAAPASQPESAKDVLTDRLQKALVQEFRSRDFYRAAAQRFELRRYTNLASAEQRHVDALTAVIAAAGAKPVTEAVDAIEVPATTAVTDARAEQLERDTIEIYRELIEHVDDQKVRAVLERIQAANFRHLAAAQNGVGGGPGRRAGAGNRRGRGVDSRGTCGLGRRF